MKPGRTAAGILALIAVLLLINAILGNIVANLLQEWLGPKAWLVVFPFIVIAAILIGFELRDRLKGSADERPGVDLGGQNRARMLVRVRKTWIDGMLRQSLHGAALLALGIEERPDSVAYPWELIIERPKQAPHLLPPGTRIAEIFDEVEDELLVLGAPGAGKTTMLLDLARTLLDRAEQDEKHPIPVVFNLSSWSAQRPPLASWLVAEMSERYDVPLKFAQGWIEAEAVILLLDGLDEVKQEHRTACVEAINAYRSGHGFQAMVICSRIAEYEDLSQRLRLRGAILLQPLTDTQIDAYLVSGGDQLAALRAAIQRDAALHELAKTPLMLSVMTLAYQGVPTIALEGHPSLTVWQDELFAAYVERMLAWPRLDTRYSSQQLFRYLGWLARTMVLFNQSVFYRDYLQPELLTTRIQKWGYDVSVILTLCLIFTTVQKICAKT